MRLYTAVWLWWWSFIKLVAHTITRKRSQMPPPPPPPPSHSTSSSCKKTNYYEKMYGRERSVCVCLCISCTRTALCWHPRARTHTQNYCCAVQRCYIARSLTQLIYRPWLVYSTLSYLFLRVAALYVIMCVCDDYDDEFAYVCVCVSA